MLHFVLVLALIVAIVAVVFALQNSTPVVVSLLAWQVEINLALLLLTTFTLGVLTSLMVSVPAMLLRWRKKRRKGQEKEQNSEPDQSERVLEQAEPDDEEGTQQEGEAVT